MSAKGNAVARSVVRIAVFSSFPSQALGGRFSSVLPSDILKPGAFAIVSLPARARPHGKEFAPLYGNNSELRKISSLMAKCVAAGVPRTPDAVSASVSRSQSQKGNVLHDPNSTFCMSHCVANDARVQRRRLRTPCLHELHWSTNSNLVCTSCPAGSLNSNAIRRYRAAPALLQCRDGCHHCGKRAGKAIADHIPPNVIAYGQGYRTRLQVERPLASPGPKTKRAVSQALKLIGESLPLLSSAAGLGHAVMCSDLAPTQNCRATFWDINCVGPTAMLPAIAVLKSANRHSNCSSERHKQPLSSQECDRYRCWQGSRSQQRR